MKHQGDVCIMSLPFKRDSGVMLKESLDKIPIDDRKFKRELKKTDIGKHIYDKSGKGLRKSRMTSNASIS